MEGDRAMREEFFAPWTSPALEELLPDLSLEEQLRLQSEFRERERAWNRNNKNKQPPPPSMWSESERDSSIITPARHALRHYNARHPGGEFDLVKPLMASSAGFRNQAWFHVNFWARSRSGSKIIKRFFAEVHYKPSSGVQMLLRSLAEVRNKRSSGSKIPKRFFAEPSSGSLADPYPTPIVEICTIIEEPLSQYRRSCAFCRGSNDILHPKGCRKFVCGNDKDRMEQQLVRRTIVGGGLPGRPFTCRPDTASPNTSESA